jgi:uncharacterized protein (DUF1501 family)
MKRRYFLESAAALSSTFLTNTHLAAAEPSSQKNVIVNINLNGGPDFRHLLCPDQNTDYGQAYWKSRYSLWNINSEAQVPSITQQLHWVDHPSTTFGFHPQATWLRDQWIQGKVAIINNVGITTSRNHDHGTIRLESGDVDALPNDRQLSGWGGRCAHAMSENILSLTPRVSQFCYGPHPSHPKRHDNEIVYSIRDMQKFGLYKPDGLTSTPNGAGAQSVMYRALSSYYQKKNPQLPRSSPYRPAIDHFIKMNALGDQVKARLSNIDFPVELSEMVNGHRTCHHRPFAKECKNLVEALQAIDLFKASICSLSYLGFDSHKSQYSSLQEKFYDLFHNDGALAQANQQISLLSPHISPVYVLHGEFGRQLKANGDRGTDHGYANSMIVVGKGVRGGIYGNMFPAEEIQKFSTYGEHIEAKTSIEPILSKLCNWLSPGIGDLVCPKATTRMLEHPSVLDFI